MIEILKLILATIKEQKELKRYNATLVKMPINYEALEYITNRAIAKNIEIEIKQIDGTIITIRPKISNNTGFVPFKEKFEKARQI